MDGSLSRAIPYIRNPTTDQIGFIHDSRTTSQEQEIRIDLSGACFCDVRMDHRKAVLDVLFFLKLVRL